MYRSIVSAVSAAAVSLCLLSGAALAQVQLADEVSEKLMTMGIDTTLIVSEEQLLEIEAVLNGTDDDATKTEAINAILAE